MGPGELRPMQCCTAATNEENAKLKKRIEDLEGVEAALEEELGKHKRALADAAMRLSAPTSDSTTQTLLNQRRVLKDALTYTQHELGNLMGPMMAGKLTPAQVHARLDALKAYGFAMLLRAECD